MIDYGVINRQLEALIDGESNHIGILANAAALLKESTGWFWVGFYMVKDDILQLGPFQGPVACYSIGYGKGVCGTAWKDKRTLIVPDVEEFPGHIACSSLSRSEIVVPIWKNEEIIGVLDIDSRDLNEFNEGDGEGLEQFCRILSSRL